MKIHNYPFTEQDEIIALVRQYMCTAQQPLLNRLIGALKGLYPPEIVEYLQGVYCLEFGRIYVLGRGKYIETNVSFRRARRHLKRALRAKPQDAEILTALGESFCKERRPAQALKYCDKALALVPDNPRFVWNAMEHSYLLARYESVLSYDDTFHWETCTDRARYFWCGVLCAYSAATLGDTEKVRKLAFRVLKSYTPELPQCDIAAACLLDVLFFAGWVDELKKQYDQCAQTVSCISSPLLLSIRNRKEGISRQELTSQILAAFTPQNLLPHLAW